MEQRLVDPILPKENSTRAQNFRQGKWIEQCNGHLLALCVRWIVFTKLQTRQVD